MAATTRTGSSLSTLRITDFVACDRFRNLEPFQHEEGCPCHGLTTYMTITHDAGLRDILTIHVTIKVKPKLE